MNDQITVKQAGSLCAISMLALKVVTKSVLAIKAIDVFLKFILLPNNLIFGSLVSLGYNLVTFKIFLQIELK